MKSANCGFLTLYESEEKSVENFNAIFSIVSQSFSALRKYLILTETPDKIVAEIEGEQIEISLRASKDASGKKRAHLLSMRLLANKIQPDLFVSLLLKSS